MTILCIRLPTVLRDAESGRVLKIINQDEYLIHDTTKNFHDKFSTLPAKELALPPHRFQIGTHTYVTLPADSLDRYKRLKRGAQIITTKDLGNIITLLGLNKESCVVEAGTGSGAVAVYLASFVSEVHSYDIRKEALSLGEENARLTGWTNIQFHQGSVYDDNQVKAHDADALILDVPDPTKTISCIRKILRVGGRCVVYAPQITQVQQLIEQLPCDLLHIQTTEYIERAWDIRPHVLRPKSQGADHTGFLCLLRKLPP